MKHFYLLLILFLGQILQSQNFTDTKGELQISNSGQATYNLPIALPPSIKNVAPTINLTYTSGVRGGIAGQGWNINSISAISRIATRRDIDGYVDGVDFDADDKLALDGQRLLIKSGTYWANGSIYETEYKSNTKIELKIEGTTTYFIVTAPDGSRSWYGSKGNGSLQNSVSVNSWYIVHFEDVYGNSVDYNYTNVVYNNTNQLYIDNITFGGNPSQSVASQNMIKFNYRDAKRIERDFIKGTPVYATKILDNIQVSTNNALFRKYQLTQMEDHNLGYERVTKVQEFNAQNEASNPVIFDYVNTSNYNATVRIEKSYTNNLNFEDVKLAGDFDGDGRLDFVADNKVFTDLFKENTGNTPINLPFAVNKRKELVATTISNNRLNQFQSLVNVNETSTLTEFRIYNMNNGIFVNDYIKTIQINNQGLKVTNNGGVQCNGNYLKTTNEYFEGDFNGDGISEVLIKKSINETKEYIYGCQIVSQGQRVCSCRYLGTKDEGSEYFLLDLNSNVSNDIGTKGFVQLTTTTTTTTTTYFDGKKYIADFNGDGKSDILVLKNDKTYKIISFKQLTVSPWVELEVIGSGTLDKYSDTKQMLLGDYNGDGKTDIMLPDTEGGEGHVLWHTYYSNPKPAGGEFFVKESQNIVEYRPDTGNAYNTQRHWSNYYAIDINGDGKSDLVRVWRKYYKPSWTINDHNTQWQVTAFTNNIGYVANSKYLQTYDSGLFDSGSPDIPIPLVSNYKYQGANSELVIVRGHYNKIEYYQFNEDLNVNNRLISVTEASGNIKQTIDYLPMQAVNEGLGNYTTDFYSSTNTATYPNVEIIRNSDNFLVSKLTATINGVSKFQDFKYRSYISNFDYGTVGFARTSRSSWYLSPSDTKIWTTQNNDINLKGANTITWSSTNPGTVFAATPDNLLSTKTNVFATYTNPVSKVYNVLLSSQTTLDALTGVKSEDTFTYDGTVTSINYYGLQMESVNKRYSGSSLQGTTTTNYTYDNNPGGVGSAYYIGRPKSTTNSSNNIATGETRTSAETYTYTGFNLTKTEKTGHNTTYAIVEDMTYDNVGNLLTKTVSAPNAPVAIASRTITDQYDTTKRFVIKKTDHQGFETNFVYNPLGQVTQSTNYLGVISDYTYDNWGKLTKTKTTGVSTTPLETTITYAKLTDGGYTTTSQNTVGDQAKTITQYDVLGREVIKTTKGFAANSLISKQIVYDGLGRKLKESEPYFSSPGKWTMYEYDYLSRPTKVTASTGRIQTLSYSGLTTTSNDDGKTTTATVDALGNKVQTTDPGGTINFTYYANGQLKESDYEGHKVSITIDGWGNKTAMNDPNAGTYTYAYDAFGQITNETTPKGTTTNTYDDDGKLTKKITLGDGADFVTDYAYNSLGQLTSEISKKSTAAAIDTYTYTYDGLHRLSSTTESNDRFSQTKTMAYDTYGRIASVTNATQELVTGLSNAVITKNNYNTYNGVMDKLTDANNAVLWQLTGANEKMQSLTETLGNGIAITNAYDGDNYFTSQRHTKNSVDVLYNTYSFNAVKGTLNNRQNVVLGTNEVFSYDTLDRLTQWTNPLTNTNDSNTYDTKGRITNHNKLGTVNYNTDVNTGIYRKKSITLTPEGKNYYTALPKQTVTYTMFKSPIAINESDKGSTTFAYNSHLSRQTMSYGYQVTTQGQPGTYTKTKDYTDDGTVEILKTPTTITIRTYIGGDAYSAPLYMDRTRTITTGAVVDKKYYLHRDYLGSIIAISDETGTAVERRQFDAWGNLAKLQQNGVAVTLPTDGTAAKLMMLDRGYTSHEHLAEVGLIHMNGRLYDPTLRSFLMPDNFIQQPENTQNYNRYAYVLNNPLMYTDPSGELGFLVAVGIGMLVAATTYTMTALLADVPFSVGGLLKATFIGAGTAAVTFGIGQAAENLFSATGTFAAKATFQAFAHGTFQGIMTSVSGGKFWSGFAAGAISSIVASAWGGGNANQWQGLGGNFAHSDLGTIAFGTVSGGAAAKLTGGNFWQGAVTGLFVSGLNHAMHQMTLGDPPNKYKKYFAQKAEEAKYLDKSLNLDTSSAASVAPFALTAAAVDGPIPIGDIIGGIAITGAAAYDLSQRVYVTYTLRNSAGQVYAGRASGFGSPYGIMMGRYASHHMRAFGYGSPTLDVASQGYPMGYYAIRGREQQLIDFFGGVGSPNVGNSINAIWQYNPNRPLYMSASNSMFGPLK